MSDGTALPAWLSFNAATRTFSGTPQEADTPATLTIRLTATDDGSPAASSSTTFTLTVPETNDRPPEPQVSDQTATVDQSFTYTVPAVTDPDGDTLTYNATLGPSGNPLPEWLSFNAGARTFTGTPRSADVGEYTIVVTVEDQEFTGESSFVITVEVSANQAPVAPALSAQTATEDQAFTYTPPAFTDPEGDSLTYSASLSDGTALPSWLSFNAETRTFSGTPQEADTPATLTVRLTATDDGAPPASSSATFTLTVQDTNDAPVAVDDTATVAEGDTLIVAASTLLANDFDPENTTLSVTAVGGAVNGTVSLSSDRTMATYVHDGSETTAGSFTYTVSDGAATDTATVTITVSPVNDAPVAPSISAQTAVERQAFTYTPPAFTDPEGDSLTYSAALSDGAALPEWLSFNAATRTFSGTPQEADTPAILTIRLTATDDGTPPASSSATFSLTVQDTNDAPIAVDDTATVAEGGTLIIAASTLLANDSDPENTTLSVTAVGGAVNGTVSLSADRTTAAYVHDGSETTAGSFTYTVSDGAAIDTATVTITVSPVNDAPVAPSISDQTAVEAQAFTFQPPAFTDPEADSLTYTAALSDGATLPAWLSFNAATRTFSGTPQEADTPATLTIRLTATDDGSPPASSSATFTLTVQETNSSPPNPEVSDQTAIVDQSFTYTVPAVTDPDGDTLTYNATLGPSSNPLPEWLSFDANTRTLSGTPRSADIGEYTIVVTVEDQEFTAESSFVLTVEVATSSASGPPAVGGADGDGGCCLQLHLQCRYRPRRWRRHVHGGPGEQ